MERFKDLDILDKAFIPNIYDILLIDKEYDFGITDIQSDIQSDLFDWLFDEISYYFTGTSSHSLTTSSSFSW